MALSKDEKPVVTGLVLAGGRARRFGGVDKGLVSFLGRPMIAHVLERLAPQVEEILISANRNVPTYAGFGHRVIEDERQDFPGPLAGIQRGLAEATHLLVATVPCDAPLLPRDLIQRLLQALRAHQADAAVATVGTRNQPVFALYRRSVLPTLEDYLARDGRKVDAWHSTLRVVPVPFDDVAESFTNINTPDDLTRAEREA